MRGCRPLRDREVTRILKTLDGRWAARDRALVLLGIKSGFRISELLSLRLKDVVQHGKLVDRVSVRRRSMKGKISGRTVLLHPEARKAVLSWLKQLQPCNRWRADTFLFVSGKGDNRPITRIHAYRLLRTACQANQLQGVLATHSLRKTFAHRIYERLGHDLIKTQQALGHRSITSTVQYLSFSEAEIDRAIREI